MKCSALDQVFNLFPDLSSDQSLCWRSWQKWKTAVKRCAFS
ncbi:hypothetical protein PO124_29415 [Bacillus licheniformis]|nr:hypothetical protein [Bacillus licheniformis]